MPGAFKRDFGYAEILTGILLLTVSISGTVIVIAEQCKTEGSTSYGGQSTLLEDGSVEISTNAPELENHKAEIFVIIEDSDTNLTYVDRWSAAGGRTLSDTGSPDLSENLIVDARKIPFTASTGDVVRLIYVGESYQVPAYCNNFIRRSLYVRAITE